MADQPKAGAKPRLFRARGVQQVGSGQDGNFAFVELVEVTGEVIAVAFPPAAAAEFSNRILTAADLANAQQLKNKPPGDQQPMPAPLVTEHMAVPTPDGDTIHLSLMVGQTSLVVRLSKSRSEKLRASLERCEGQISSNSAPAAANED